MERIAFIGLGVMGYPMAGHVASAGFDVRVFNRTSEKSSRWANQYPGESCPNIKECVAGASVVLLCVGDDPDVEEVLTCASGVFAHVPAGSVVVDHTTASAGLAQRMAREAAEHDVRFLDAPVSGGQAGAENGTLSVMLGGDAAALSKVMPVLETYAAKVTHIGPSGHGQLAKMVNQICIAGIVQGLAEGLRFAELSGLDGDQLIAAIGGGAAQSWQMDNRSKTMRDGEYEHGFAVDWMRKDLRIALEAARELGANIPVAAMVDQFYAEVQQMGGGRWDTSSLLKRLQSFGSD